MQYYDPMFYICSERMPFSIRIEVTLREEINGDILGAAVNRAIRRYPYFALRLTEQDGDLTGVPNGLPIRVFRGALPGALGSEALNYHVLALTYEGREINFHTTHVMTDGAGFMPFVKTVLYCYLCARLGRVLPEKGIRLPDSPMLEGEAGNPYPEERMRSAVPFYTPPEKPFFRLEEGGFVSDEVRTSFNFRAKEADVMEFSFENDASPCALFSSVIAKAIRAVHPDEEKDLVSAVSFNQRPALGCMNSYRMLCSSLPIRYAKKLDASPVRRMCTCTRGSILVQSQPENVLFDAKGKKEMLEALLRLPDSGEKHRRLSEAALSDSVRNTFSVSYVGRIDYGALTPHMESIRFYTDGSTYRTLFLEISSFDGWFYLTLQQGFSSDVYYRALLALLRENGIEIIEDSVVPLGTAEITAQRSE